MLPHSISRLRQQLHDLGCKPCHEDRLLRGWSQVGSYDRKGSPAATFFPAALREALPTIEAGLENLARLKSEHHAGAEVSRLLVELHDGQMVESVLLPRGGLCISTQVGCAVGCVFCMSGRAGLIRQLGSAEIVAQVVLARRRRDVSKVVFMGMGEPAHNLDNVLEAIDLLGRYGNIGHKELVLSTVGDARVFERLMERVQTSGATPLQLPLVRGSAESAPPLTRGGWGGVSLPLNPPSPFRCTAPMRHCGQNCCPAHRRYPSRNWCNAPRTMRAPRLTRCNINGR